MKPPHKMNSVPEFSSFLCLHVDSTIKLNKMAIQSNITTISWNVFFIYAHCKILSFKTISLNTCSSALGLILSLLRSSLNIYRRNKQNEAVHIVCAANVMVQETVVSRLNISTHSVSFWELQKNTEQLPWSKLMHYGTAEYHDKLIPQHEKSW
jgi:hypothetical protein